MNPSRRHGWLVALAVAAAGCFDEAVPVPDAGSTPLEDVVAAKDLGGLDDRGPLDAGAPDAPSADLPEAVDAPDAPLPDAPSPADLGPRCATSADCAGGGRCGPDGLCVACLPSDDRCPAAQHCDPASFVCVPGCRADEGCAATPRADGGVAPGRCDTARHVCLDCNDDDDCPLRATCQMGQCLPGCNERRGCAPGEVCCTGSCVDVRADIANCGACARRCAAANGVPACTAGVCGIEACTAGFADCNRDLADGCESDLQRDPARCGMCDVSCPTPPGAGAVACVGGRCGFTCAAGTADCDGDARTGCERMVTGDPGNCGRCGNVCPARPGAAVPRCEAGRCGVTCDVGRGDCDGDADNGCETDVRTALAHCGTCGTACPSPANAAATCAAGRCGLTCAAGYANCDGDAANGCETDLRTTATSCGRCGAVCTVSGGTPACIDGACTIATCGGSFANCDGVSGNGCETDTRSAAGHCGACGRACPAAPNATPTCAASACGTRCSPSFADCDAAAANGCETDTRNSVVHCGACGRACAVNNGTAGCSGGVCVVAGCDAGKGNCDGSAANGCETDLATSPTHCGACGVVGAETCDGRDNSCDGVADNGCPAGLGGLASFDYTSAEYGSGSGTSQSATCPSGQVVRGVFGKVNGNVVTELDVICGRPALTEDRTVTPYRYAVTLSGSTDVGILGTVPTAGTAFRFVCPDSSVVTRIAGGASTYVYSLSVQCSTLTVTGNPGALRVTAALAATSPVWGTAMGTAYSYQCPSNVAGSASALRGLFGRSRRILSTLSFVTSVGARCGVPAITVQ